MDRHDPANYKPAPDTCLACYHSGFCGRCKGNGRIHLGRTGPSIACPNCGGSGVCPECDGTGRIRDKPKLPLVKQDLDACWACDGTGFCSRCKGNGHYLVHGRDVSVLVECAVCDSSGACRSCEGT